MINLTVAFVAGVGMGVFLELLEWNVPSPAKQQFILFIVVMVVLVVRVGALRKGVRTGDRSTWQHGAATTLRAGGDLLRRRVSAHRYLAVHRGGGPLALRAVGRQRRPAQPDLHLLGRRAVAHDADRMGGPGLPGAVRPGRGGGPRRRPPGQLAPAARRHALRRGRDGAGRHPRGPAGPAHAGPLLGRHDPRLRHLHAERRPGHPVHHGARHRQDAVHGSAQPGLHGGQPAQPVRPQPGLAALLRVVLGGRADPVRPHGAGLARQGRGPPARGGARQRSRCGGHGDPDPAHQAAGLRALRLHRRLRRGLLRLRHPAAQQHRHHLRPDDVLRHHLHGGHRRAGFHPRRHTRGAVPRGAACHLRRQPDHSVHHQRPRPAGLHPLPARRDGRAAAPLRRPGHGGHPRTVASARPRRRARWPWRPTGRSGDGRAPDRPVSRWRVCRCASAACTRSTA